MKMEIAKITETLKAGGIGVLPTDTIFGLVGSALNEETVERIYRVRERRPDKPLIVLISSLADLSLFGLKPDPDTVAILKKYWPGKVSIILPLPRHNAVKAGLPPLKKFHYLHRGTNAIAFRLPAKKSLIEILKQTGPLVAPSANPEGKLPASSVKLARIYFGGKVDFYHGRGEIFAAPSALIEIIGKKIIIKR